MAPNPQARLSRSFSTSVHSLVNITLAIIACVTFVSPVDAQTIAAGGQHTVVVTPGGHVWTWGNNSANQLGLGTGAGPNKKVPTQVTALSSIVVTAVAAGNDFTLALDNTGAVWAWCGNGSGQLGLGDNNARNVPTQITALSGLTIVAIAAGQGHSVALDATGVVYTWGLNTSGQLGNNNAPTNSNVPIPLTLASPAVTAITAGQNHTLVVKSDKTVWGWGRNAFGQLGIGNNTPTNRPSPVQMSGVTTAVAVAGGGEHSLILLDDGTVQSAGNNSSQQLGINLSTQHSPVTVTGLSGVTAIRAGEHHSVVRKSDGTVRVFGLAAHLGTGASFNSPTPVTPTGLPSTIALIATGLNHTFAVTDDGVVWTWGWNSSGQLRSRGVTSLWVSRLQAWRTSLRQIISAASQR